VKSLGNLRTIAVIGIDPGVSSGVSVVSVEKIPRLLRSELFNFTKPRKGQFKTPSVLLANMIIEMDKERIDIIGAVIEDQYVGQNVRSSLTLAHNAGRWEEAIANIGVGCEYVLPSHWQRLELSGVTGGRAKRDVLKRAARDIAERHFAVRLSVDAADAALIGRYYARKKLTGLIRKGIA